MTVIEQKKFFLSIAIYFKKKKNQKVFTVTVCTKAVTIWRRCALVLTGLSVLTKDLNRSIKSPHILVF